MLQLRTFLLYHSQIRWGAVDRCAIESCEHSAETTPQVGFSTRSWSFNGSRFFGEAQHPNPVVIKSMMELWFPPWSARLLHCRVSILDTSAPQIERVPSRELYKKSIPNCTANINLIGIVWCYYTWSCHKHQFIWCLPIWCFGAPARGHLWPFRVRRFQHQAGRCNGQSPGFINHQESKLSTEYRNQKTSTKCRSGESIWRLFRSASPVCEKNFTMFFGCFKCFGRLKSTKLVASLRHWGCTASGLALPFNSEASWKRALAWSFHGNDMLVVWKTTQNDLIWWLRLLQVKLLTTNQECLGPWHPNRLVLQGGLQISMPGFSKSP